VSAIGEQRGAFRWPRLAIARVCHASATAAALHGVYFLISFALAETISQKESELFLKESLCIILSQTSSFPIKMVLTSPNLIFKQKRDYSSFKILVPDGLFSKLLCPNFWPADIIVHEYIKKIAPFPRLLCRRPALI